MRETESKRDNDYWQNDIGRWVGVSKTNGARDRQTDRQTDR